MVNLFKSFQIKNKQEENNYEEEEENAAPVVDLKEQSFQAIMDFDGTYIREKKDSPSPRRTTVSDLIFILLQSIGEENPDTLQKYLPKLINHLLEHGKPSKDPKSQFWSKENYTLAVKLFAQSITEYDSPKLPRIFFNSLIKPLIDRNMIVQRNLRLVPEENDKAQTSKPYYALIFLIHNELKDKAKTEFEKSLKGELAQLKDIAEENGEEDNYLISEI